MQRKVKENTSGYLATTMTYNIPIVNTGKTGKRYFKFNMFEIWKNCDDLILKTKCSNQRNNIFTASMKSGVESQKER